MKKTFKKLKADAGKLNVQLVHDYYPLKDDKDVYVEVEHLKNGDIINFMDVETREVDYGKMFLRKVKAIHGVTIEGEDGNEMEATKNDVVNILDPDFLAIVMGTCTHLLEGMKLTEDESKN